MDGIKVPGTQQASCGHQLSSRPAAVIHSSAAISLLMGSVRGGLCLLPGSSSCHQGKSGCAPTQVRSREPPQRSRQRPAVCSHERSQCHPQAGEAVVWVNTSTVAAKLLINHAHPQVCWQTMQGLQVHLSGRSKARAVLPSGFSCVNPQLPFLTCPVQPDPTIHTTNLARGSADIGRLQVRRSPTALRASLGEPSHGQKRRRGGKIGGRLGRPAPRDAALGRIKVGACRDLGRASSRSRMHGGCCSRSTSRGRWLLT